MAHSDSNYYLKYTKLSECDDGFQEQLTNRARAPVTGIVIEDDPAYVNPGS